MTHGLFDWPGTEGDWAAAGREPDAEAGVAMREATAADWAMVGEYAQPRRYRAASRHLVGLGRAFGELTFLTGEPAAAYAGADGTVQRVSLGGFEVLAGKEPTLTRRLTLGLPRVLAGSGRSGRPPLFRTGSGRWFGWTARAVWPPSP